LIYNNIENVLCIGLIGSLFTWEVGYVASGILSFKYVVLFTLIIDMISFSLCKLFCWIRDNDQWFAGGLQAFFTQNH